jgi:hypothetical protein
MAVNIRSFKVFCLSPELTGNMLQLLVKTVITIVIRRKAQLQPKMPLPLDKETGYRTNKNTNKGTQPVDNQGQK